jgi:hypothetical protein
VLTSHSSMKSLVDPDEAVTAQNTVLNRPRLPKSKTSVSFSSQLRRQTIPDRHLLKPVLPPLPHSQSLVNTSCFTAGRPTPSPAEPARKIFSRHKSEPPVTAVDAILESRMTAHEIEVLNQVQKEALLNRDRFRLRYSDGMSASASSSSLHLAKMEPETATQSTPAFPTAITKKQRAGRKSLTVDTERANSATIWPVPQTTHSDDGGNESPAVDPRHVSELLPLRWPFIEVL